MQNNNPIYTIQDMYTSAPVEQSTDRLTNQTSFVVNFSNAYHLAQQCSVDFLVDLKCKYCKGFYFPSSMQQCESKQISKDIHKRRNRASLGQFEVQQDFICGLCGAVNQLKSKQTLSKLPQFEPISKESKSQSDGFRRFNSHFQSLIVSKEKKGDENGVKSLKKGQEGGHKQNSILFVFYIDLTSLNQTVKQPIITYLKTVIREYFSSYYKWSQSNPQMCDTNEQSMGETKSQAQMQECYKIIFALNINDQLHLANIKTTSTINIESIANEKILSGIASENTPEMYQKENQRKQALVLLVSQCAVQLRESQSLDKIDEYLELMLDDAGEEEENIRPKHGVNGTANYNILIELLAIDKQPANSYIISYIGATPLLNYQPHRITKPSIYSLCYIFHSPSQQSHDLRSTNPQSVTFFRPMAHTKFQEANLRNDIQLIKDNNQVNFLVASQKGFQQFYYHLYELFSIVEMPKLFRPKWTVKTDNKYPPLLTNDLPSFFIKPSSLLLFIVSCLIDTSNNHKKFQVSVVFEDSQRNQKLWIINFTKDLFKQADDLNQVYKLSNFSHSQINETEPFSMMQKLPQIYNYLAALAKFAISMCIRSKSDLMSGNNINQKKSLFTLNTITSHQICVLFESIINHGTFKTSNIEIGIDCIQSVYEYCSGVKSISHQILKFLNNCETNPRKAAQMIYPLLVRHHSEQTSSCIVYWGDGYYCLNDHSQDENSQDEDWYAQFIDSHHQSAAKFYTKRCYYQHNAHSDENDLIKFYLKKLDLKERRQTYLPLYFLPTYQ